jgi:hypothetical protein
VALNAGAFSVAESSLTGYSQKSAVGCSGSIAVGETKTCTITNDDDAPHLIIIKHVINVNGGTKTADKFSGTIGGVTVAGGNTWVGAESPGVDKTLTSVGSYNVTENADPDYNATYSTDCAGTIALGQTKTCTVTNDDKASHLIIIKNVVNDNGGTKVASNFSGTITGVTALDGNTWVGTPSPGVDKFLMSVGSYSVVENLDPDYDTTYSAGCSGTIGINEIKTCIVTNNDKPGRLIIIKNVINNDGGTAPASAFSGTISGVSVVGGNTWIGTASPGVTKNLITVGNYTITENAASGYTTTYSADCTGTIAVAQTKTCIVTNDDVDPFLKVVKVLVPPTDPGRFNLTINGTHYVSSPNDPAGNGDATAFVPVTANTTLTVGETAIAPAVLSDYVTTYGGDCDAKGHITMSLGQYATCVITNIKAGHISVNKTVNGAAISSLDSFSFQLRYGASPTQAGTLLESGIASGSNNGVINFKTPLDPSKTYQLCEYVHVGWNSSLPNTFILPSGSGDNGTICTNFTVQAGQNLVFTVDNSRPPGGLSRTIGYWKNWSSCTGGKQSPELDNNLPIGIGVLTIPATYTGCEWGVDILSKSDLSGKKYASDPAYNMAAQLLAAMLNYRAGAVPISTAYCPAYWQAIESGNALLKTISFDADEPYAKTLTSAQATAANTLATLLDKYNNDNIGFCVTPVTVVPASPKFTSADNTSISLAAPVTFQVTATGSPTLTLGLVGSLPTGVSFNAGTGVLSVGPTAAPGVYTITFKASNFATVTQTFTLTITP